ncbi:MAG: sensor domain-containing diguanylate cyclase [Deltaproteobacteria bacterium]|nr:MAG: sensor domain-containing diguanylate cyclase [Deltaproteobacteria bacterium]
MPGRPVRVRTKLYLCLLLLFIPLLLLGSGAYYTLGRVSENLDDMVERTLIDLPRITNLKSLLLLAKMPPNDYLISGNAGERVTFDNFSSRIDEALFKIRTSQRTNDEALFLVELAAENWRKSRSLAHAIFAIENIRTPAAENAMREFDAQMARTIALLDQLERESFHLVEAGVDKTRARQRSMLLGTALTCGLALLIGIVTTVLLTRAVVRPLAALRRHAYRLGQGDLKTRINLPLDDEFGSLAEVFNTMAGNLERSQEVLHDMAMRDGLTGLYNRREFHHRLQAEFDRARRRQSPLSILMMDIDHFKKVNDTYGHLVGDEVLREVAARVGRHIRTMDFLARYGGEEFVIITPEPHQGALVLAERIRAQVADEPVLISDGQLLPVTISLGCATWPDQGETDLELVNLADQALYSAKEQGRNRVVGQPPSGGKPKLKVISEPC